MTSYSQVYDAFMARILEDDWNDTWTREEVEADQRLILEAALPWFKFPRVSLEHDDTGFSGDLGQKEIQIIANFMKCEWLDRCIMTWENVKPLYVERDFSQGNLIDKLKQLLEFEKKKAQEAESIYYRSRNGKPFNFGKLASNPKDAR
jgi:hypothetical protein